MTSIEELNVTAPAREPKIESPLVIIGWREWVTLPDLGIVRIKAKIDTGARSSSLHTYALESFEVDGQMFVRFKVHPIQRHDEFSVTCHAPVHDVRNVRSSSGEVSERYVIQTQVNWMGESWKIDLTLFNRAEMGFRMLLGREAIRQRMLVDPGGSYFGGRPRRKKKRRRRRS